MLSLPSDSYMFRPVAPATAPHPLQEVEMETYSSAPSGMSPGWVWSAGPGKGENGSQEKSGPGRDGDWVGRHTGTEQNSGWELGWAGYTGQGRVVGDRVVGERVVATQFRCISAPGTATSAHSPPLEPCASLQVPPAMSSPAKGSDPQCAPPPQGAPRSPSLGRLLCRQVGELLPLGPGNSAPFLLSIWRRHKPGLCPGDSGFLGCYLLVSEHCGQSTMQLRE